MTSLQSLCNKFAPLFVLVVLLTACNAESALKKGDQFYSRGEYYDAAAEYKRAYSRTPLRQRSQRGERALKMADCYRRINYTAKAVGAYQNARRYTEKATSDRAKALKTKQDLEYRKQRLKAEKQAAKATADSARANRKRRQQGFTNPNPVEEPTPVPDKLFASTEDSIAEATVLAATLQLARLQHKNGDYKSAIKSYEHYIEQARILYPIHPTICTPQNDTIAINGLIGARSALRWKQNPTLHTIRKEPILASRRADFSPALLGDDADQIYFTSTRQQATGDDISGITGTKYADIFFAKRDENGRWQQPEAVEGELNTELDEGVCCFSPDGKTMYLTRCTTDPDYPRYAKIFTSQRSDASWGKPTELKISRDTLSAFAHPAVSPDGEWLYFVSDMPGGHGGKDIWRIAILGTSLGGVENLEAPINTPGDEMFPTFRPNGDLYFSSDGHPGMGGLDIFIAKPMSNDQLVMSNDDYQTSEAPASKGNHNYSSQITNYKLEHPGFPLNSQGDDFGMTFEGMKNQGYFSSNRGDGRGFDHIYSFFNPDVVQTVKGWVYEQDGYELPAAQVYIVGNDGTNQRLSVRGDGSFTQEIKPRVDYVLLATCKGCLVRGL